MVFQIVCNRGITPLREEEECGSMSEGEWLCREKKGKGGKTEFRGAAIFSAHYEEAGK